MFAAVKFAANIPDGVDTLAPPLGDQLELKVELAKSGSLMGITVA
jgi:hypothetical protein